MNCGSEAETEERQWKRQRAEWVKGRVAEWQRQRNATGREQSRAEAEVVQRGSMVLLPFALCVLRWDGMGWDGNAGTETSQLVNEEKPHRRQVGTAAPAIPAGRQTGEAVLILNVGFDI